MSYRSEYPQLYSSWAGMKERCYSPRNCAYKNYGGKGIKVCREWQTFEPFKNWALQNGYEPGLTIDRINVNGNYEPNNCQWITALENTIKGNMERKGIHFVSLKTKPEIVKQIIHLLETTNLSYLYIANRYGISEGAVSDINLCHTYNKFHNYKYNIRTEFKSVTTNPDECKGVE